MARPDLSESTTNRDKWNNSVSWNNQAGDWWDKTATAQGSVAWATAFVADTDTARSITFNVTDWSQSVYDNADWTSAVVIRASGGTDTQFASRAATNASDRPKISYDGGADQTCTDCVSISPGSFGGSTSSPLGTSSANILIEFPPPTTRPTSATLTLYTTAQFGDQTVSVFWLRYPTESAPTISSLPAAPTGVSASNITPVGATVSWTDASLNETGFRVQYAPSPYTTWTTAAGSPTAANATSLGISGLSDGTTYKARVASTNAIGDSAFVESGIFTTQSLTKVRPSATTSSGSWTAVGAASLHAAINETPASDAEYINAAVATTSKVKIATLANPGTTSFHSFQYRAKGDGTSQLKVDLVQGDPTETLIKSTTITPTTNFATYTVTLTSGEAAVITDYTALYFKFVSL